MLDDYEYDYTSPVNKGKKFQGKTFLTERGDEGGSIRWTTRWENEYLNACVTLTDCSNSIDLEFYAKNEKEQSKRLLKLDTLINELQSFRKSISIKEFKKPKFYY